MPSCRCARSASAAVSRSTASCAEQPPRRSSSPSGPYRGLAYDCVAIAPTCGSAHGTTEPTARNFDCTATLHCAASRSQATIEKVATGVLAIRELGQVELEQVSAIGRDERAGDLRPRKRASDRLRVPRSHDDGSTLVVRRAQHVVVGDVVEDERAFDVELALDRQLRHAAAGGSEPALANR